jgi:hypothetical protein
MKPFFSILPLLILISCNAGNNKNSGGDSVVHNYENIPPERKTVNPDPIKTYEEIINSFETTDEFKVGLYETKETFHYLVKVQYKNLDEEDTLKVPDFGIEPAVEIVKGDSIRPSCIVGFYDEKNQFRESKLIYFEDNSLKIKVLKHYAVATYQSEAQ